MDNQFVYKEKSFPYLTISVILFFIGIVLLGAIWIAATNVKKTTPSPITKLPASITPHPSTSIFATQEATASSQAAFFTFPTKQLTLTVPQNWITTTGTSDTHQIVKWWQVDNTLIFSSADTKPVDQSGCPEGGCPNMPAASVTIADFGASSFITAQAWFEGQSTKQLSTVASSSASPLSITTGTFATLPVYCASPDGQTSPSGVPSMIPSGIFTGTCYLIWQAHVYAISASLDKTSLVYSKNFNQTLALLKSIQFTR